MGMRERYDWQSMRARDLTYLVISSDTLWRYNTWISRRGIRSTKEDQQAVLVLVAN